MPAAARASAFDFFPSAGRSSARAPYAFSSLMLSWPMQIAARTAHAICAFAPTVPRAARSRSWAPGMG